MRQLGPWMTVALLCGLLLGGILNGSADRWPRVLASVWLTTDGEGRIPPGQIYRLTDGQGKPLHFKERMVLTILDARPETRQ